MTERRTNNSGTEKKIDALIFAVQQLVNHPVAPVAPVAPVLPVAPVAPVTSVHYDLFLQKLDMKVDALKEDLKILLDGTNSRMNELTNAIKNLVPREDLITHIDSDVKMHNDSEARIRVLETGLTQIKTWGSAGMVSLGILQFLIGKFM